MTSKLIELLAEAVGIIDIVQVHARIGYCDSAFLNQFCRHPSYKGALAGTRRAKNEFHGQPLVGSAAQGLDEILDNGLLQRLCLIALEKLDGSIGPVGDVGPFRWPSDELTLGLGLLIAKKFPADNLEREPSSLVAPILEERSGDVFAADVESRRASAGNRASSLAGSNAMRFSCNRPRPTAQ